MLLLVVIGNLSPPTRTSGIAALVFVNVLPKGLSTVASEMLQTEQAQNKSVVNTCYICGANTCCRKKANTQKISTIAQVYLQRAIAPRAQR
jgi:GH24 family phage-related lysozyme (muramidase)